MSSRAKKIGKNIGLSREKRIRKIINSDMDELLKIILIDCIDSGYNVDIEGDFVYFNDPRFYEDDPVLQEIFERNTQKFEDYLKSKMA